LINYKFILLLEHHKHALRVYLFPDIDIFLINHSKKHDFKEMDYLK